MCIRDRDEVYGKPGKMKLPEPQLQRQLCAQKIQLIDALWKNSEPKLKEMEIVSLFYDVEMPLAVVLYKMEKEGIRIDSQTLDDLSLIHISAHRIWISARRESSLRVFILSGGF